MSRLDVLSRHAPARITEHGHDHSRRIYSMIVSLSQATNLKNI